MMPHADSRIMDRDIAMSDLSRLSKQKAITVADIEAPNVISLTASQVGLGWLFISYLIGMGLSALLFYFFSQIVTTKSQYFLSLQISVCVIFSSSSFVYLVFVPPERFELPSDDP